MEHKKYHDTYNKLFFDFIDGLNDEKAKIIKQFLDNANKMIGNHF
ncbi:hypothetical protein BD780_003351 [Clostridium tetanomorphum]|nr:hypothetical protein [Clostridium tetanomorphum]NRZ95853.1 hypothetical protein [Clostridium tetanomorphum]SQB89650.1 Uncharacterised protein [Clostridium tetanomorphum]